MNLKGTTWLDEIQDALSALREPSYLADIYAQIQREREEQQVSTDFAVTWKDNVRGVINRHCGDNEYFEQDIFFRTFDAKGKPKYGLSSWLPKRKRAQRAKTSKAAPVLPMVAPREISSLRKVRVASDIEKPPARVLYIVRRIVRDTAMVRKLKATYEDQCQLCGDTLILADGKTYSEGHHLQPLGGDHKGPDREQNILIVCPNCHVQCDYGAVKVSLSNLHIKKHEIGQAFIKYHNQIIYQRIVEE